MRLIGAPFCPEAAFEDAIRVLEEARVEASPKNPVYGMDRPFYAPGGYYGQCWWSLDYALACEGAKWVDFGAARELIYNLRHTQCPDGRVMLYGADSFSHIPNVREPVASLPKYFESCYDIAVMSGDEALCRETLALFEDSLDWWIKNRFDPKTGLFSAVFEETFVPNTVSASGVYAPLDTNIQLMLGMENTAKLIELLERKTSENINIHKTEMSEGPKRAPKEAGKYQKMAQNAQNSIKKWLFENEFGTYFPYVLNQNRRYPALLGSAFLGFYLPDEDRRDRLEALLRDPEVFGWGEIPITSAAKTDPIFTTVTGDYTGNPCWSGSIWTLINDQTVKALRRAGRRETAAELAIQTLRAFSGVINAGKNGASNGRKSDTENDTVNGPRNDTENGAGNDGKSDTAYGKMGNFAEFLHPFTGSGEGVKRYAWSAAQCIRMVVEEIFGLRYDGFRGELTAEPSPAEALRDADMALLDIPLPDGRKANASMKKGRVEIEVLK